MAKYFTDEEGKTFQLASDGRAAYPLGVRPAAAGRPATAAERAAFKKQRAAAWRVVLRWLPLCYKLASGQPELVHEEGIPCVLGCLRRWDFRGGASFGTYLYSALRRRYAGWYRGRDIPAVQDGQRGAGPGAEVENRDSVQYIMDGLDAYDRGLLVLRFWEGLTNAEIAAALGTSEATMSVEMRAAVRRAREAADERPPS